MVLASLTTTSFVVVTQWHHEDGISGLGPYGDLRSRGRYPGHLEATCVDCPILSRQKLCKWLSEIAAPWITIALCWLTEKPKHDGAQAVEHMLDNEGIGFLILIIAVTTSRENLYEWKILHLRLSVVWPSLPFEINFPCQYGG